MMLQSCCFKMTSSNCIQYWFVLKTCKQFILRWPQNIVILKIYKKNQQIIILFYFYSYIIFIFIIIIYIFIYYYYYLIIIWKPRWIEKLNENGYTTRTLPGVWSRDLWKLPGRFNWGKHAKKLVGKRNRKKSVPLDNFTGGMYLQRAAQHCPANKWYFFK